MHLLRTKLSFFGASRFDPKSDRWVRVTLFQGAPLFCELFSDHGADTARLAKLGDARAHLGAVNQVYADYVEAPYPNRAAIIVSGFAREEMLVESVAYAAVGEAP